MKPAVTQDLDRQLQAELDERARRGLARTTRLDGVVDGVDFGSNDYLGFAQRPELAEAMAAAAREFGAGGRAARLLGGGSPLHERAERALADWLGAEAALLFPSGYQANVGVVTALAGRGDALISDRDNHASLIDACRLSRADVIVHEHRDLDAVERALRAAASARRRVVLTEAVFSMQGDRAPLAALDMLCRRHDAWLVVDEAHSVGVLGPYGAGLARELLQDPDCRIAARVVTGGKALGVAGAFVAGSDVLRRQLIHAARSFVFTTATPPALAGALLRAVGLCRGAEAERAAVLANARRLARLLELPEPAAAIVPIPLGDAAAAVALAQALRERGLFAPAVRPPTVPLHAAGLRIVCHAHDRAEHIDRLAAAVRELRPATPPAAAAPRARPRAHTTFVVGTDTGIGKTVVSALLLRAALQNGEARYWKPVQTGDDDDTATVAALAGATAAQLLPNALRLPLPASPHHAAAAAGTRVDVAAIDRAFAQHCAAFDGALIVEFAGGLLVPYELEPLTTQADWLEAHDGRIVLVARSGLGTLNHTLLTLEALRRRGCEPFALLLVGEPHPANAATLREVAGVPHLFELPPLSPLDGAALDRWLAANALAEVLAEVLRR